ncbi:SMP-30/gluconolactonase/LRE family protein [Desulfuromonas acetexigens]|uniref:6-bladed beta-propeller n=1 Tax=Trichloromonas acetexigens TaxID=38815 RepID=A0A550J9J0_9BACT|nr:SMP-30/gluconolactonase/LRE family protein [Desulfuromonas acetexigens]TRO79782.1 6-bladed beta-propeller [Desulfuromonas acetexigens]
MKDHMKKPVTRLFLLFTVMIFLGGCSAKETKTRVLWPPPPNPPKLEWIGTYRSLDQMPKTASEKMTQSILGGQPVPVFKRPFGVASSGDGRIFISDVDQRQVIVYDLNKRSVYPFKNTGSIRTPFGMAMDSTGRLFVADAAGKTVLVFAPDDTPLFSIGGPELLDHPTFVALDEARDRIYVSDARAHRIAVFDMQGKHLRSFGDWGPQDGNFYSPQGMAVDKNGNLYVADMFNARVQVFDAEGKFLRKFGERGDLQSNFEMPKGIAIDSNGNLYITDARKKAMLTYNPEGRLLLFTGGGKASHPLSLMLPAGIWVDKKDQIYVVDQIGRRFAIWQYLNDAYLKEQPVE